jgi:integrase/transposase
MIRAAEPRTVAVRHKIASAARLVANGWRIEDVAARLRVTRGTVFSWKRSYPDFWRQFAAAAEKAGRAPEPPEQKRPRARPLHITPQLREKVVTAARMAASGYQTFQIAKRFAVSRQTVREWRSDYLELWQIAYDKAAADVAAVVKQTAGTDAMLTNLENYVRMAGAALRWSEAKGETLFGSGGAMTLTRFYREYYQPMRLADASPVTLENHRTTLRRWVVLTADPPLSDITPLLLAKFRDALAALAGVKPGSRMQPESIFNYLRFVQTLLDKAGPPGYRNRDAVGLIERPPYIKPPKIVRKVPKTVSLETLSAVYDAAACMERPIIEGVKAPAWWKALLVVAFNTGLRLGTLRKLRFEWIDWQAQRLMIPGDALKNRIGQVVPLNETVVRHLETIRSSRALIFPWPHNKRHFYRELHRLQTVAGMPRPQHFGTHDLRRTLATMLWGVSPQAAQAALGHQSLAITRTHYAATSGIVAQAIRDLPQPAAFGKNTTRSD